MVLLTNEVNASSIPWINVKDHGAKGDGTTDDTSAITTAIASIPSAGGVLYFPIGTYVTTGGFTLSKPVTIRGDGGLLDYDLFVPSSRITCTSQTAALFNVTSRYAHFENIALVNTFAGTPTSGSTAVKVTGLGNNDVSQKVDYHNITVAGFYIGIQSDAGWGWVLCDSLITNCVQYCVRIQNTTSPDSGNWVINNCSFLTQNYATAAAIYIIGSGGGRISNCKTTNGDAAINFIDSIDLIPNVNTSDLLIMNNSFENVQGIHINIDLSTHTAAWGNIIIVGNQMFNCTDGIYVNGYLTANIIKMVIAHNVITSVLNPITLLNCANVTLTGNVSDSDNPLVAYTNCINVVTDNSHTLKNAATIAAGANNGTTPPTPTITSDSNDTRGTITFGSGAAAAAGAQAVLTFGGRWGRTPRVFLTPLNAATAALNLYASSIAAAGGFTVSSANAPAASQAGSTFSVQYHVME